MERGTDHNPRGQGQAVARPHATPPPTAHCRQGSTRLVYDGDSSAHGSTTSRVLLVRSVSERSCVFAVDSVPHLAAMDRHRAIGFEPETNSSPLDRQDRDHHHHFLIIRPSDHNTFAVLSGQYQHGSPSSWLRIHPGKNKRQTASLPLVASACRWASIGTPSGRTARPNSNSSTVGPVVKVSHARQTLLPIRCSGIQLREAEKQKKPA